MLYKCIYKISVFIRRTQSLPNNTLEILVHLFLFEKNSSQCLKSFIFHHSNYGFRIKPQDKTQLNKMCQPSLKGFVALSERNAAFEITFPILLLQICLWLPFTCITIYKHHYLYISCYYILCVLISDILLPKKLNLFSDISIIY